MLTNNFTTLKKKHSLQIKSDINITPFVDVMLVLLIIFMVTAPMLTTGIDIDIPKAKASQALKDNEIPITISIDKHGNLYLQDNKIKIDRLLLTKKISALHREKPNAQIIVQGDKEANYGKVIEVFSILREANFANVTLLTDSIN